jgi:hypothetical protein
MTKKLLFVTAILLVVAIGAFAADVTGKWTYEQAGRQGGPARQVTITLKQDGAKLTGSVPGFGRGGDNPPPPTEITNGKVDGDKVYFEVVREFQGNKMTSKYNGSVSGSEMKLKITTETPNGPMDREVVAKKSTT